jgi:DNA-binding MarR family transcriptional regulator
MSITLTLFGAFGRCKKGVGRKMSKIKDSQNTDFNDAIELMFFAYRDFIADPDVILEAHGFGRAHHRVLHFVAGNPSISIADLLDILRVTKQSLARVLRDLIDGDYIEQRIGANDRRKRLLHLTPKGTALQGKLIAPQEKRFSEVQASLGPQAFEQWKKTMRLVINAEDRENVDELIKRSRAARTEDEA